jgi:hypothetical protein
VYAAVNASRVQHSRRCHTGGATAEASGEVQLSAVEQSLHDDYLERFGIYIIYSSPTVFSSLADQCPSAGNDIHALCTCGASCTNSDINANNSIVLSEYHHKNYRNVLLHIPSETTEPGNLTSTSVYFIGHETCSEGYCFDLTSLIAEEYLAYGLAADPYGIFSVFNFTSVDDEYVTVFHEFGHMFGVIDHYDEYVSGDNPAGLNNYCIYGKSRGLPNIVSNLTICEGCRNIILNNADRYSQ